VVDTEFLPTIIHYVNRRKWLANGERNRCRARKGKRPLPMDFFRDQHRDEWRMEKAAESCRRFALGVQCHHYRISEHSLPKSGLTKTCNIQGIKAKMLFYWDLTYTRACGVTNPK
jgi:hypothetical protein